MEDWVGILRNLQEIDINVDRLTQNREELGQAVAGKETQLKEEGLAINNLREKALQMEKDRKTKEEELKHDEEVIKKWEARLKDVKNHREYQVLIREVALAKKDNAAKEDEILKSLEEEEKIKKELKEKEEIHTGLQATYVNEKADALGKIAEIEKEIAQKTVQQKDFRNRLDSLNAGLLKEYDRIKKRRNGLALVGTSKGVCLGCHMNLPPQVVNKIMGNDEIMKCPSCQRILFWDEVQNLNSG